MSFVGRLLRFLGLAAGHSEGERRLVDARESATPDHRLEWATLHRGELEENWRLAKVRQPLRQIAPLE